MCARSDISGCAARKLKLKLKSQVAARRGEDIDLVHSHPPPSPRAQKFNVVPRIQCSKKISLSCKLALYKDI